MDILAIQQRLREGIRKYRAAVIVVLAGIFLMALPTGKPKPPPPVRQEQEKEISQVLSELLSSLEGAGRVQVLLTVAAGEETVYQFDGTMENSRTVLVSDSQRQEQGLVRMTKPPKYRGAVVLCQGADNAAVRLAVVEAVSKASGLSSDRITVLKMK